MKNTMLRLLIAGLIISLPLAPAGAQSVVNEADAARQQRDTEQIFRNLRKAGATAPDLYPDEASDTGPQSVLRARPRPTWFDVSIDGQLFYTDNMLFQQQAAERTEASVFVNTVQVALTPPPCETGCGRLAPRLGYRHQWFNYGLVEGSAVKNFYDFDSETVFADATWQAGPWQFQAGFDWTRLLDHQPTYTSYHELYNELSPRWGVQRVIPVCPRSALLLAYLGSYHFSRVDPVTVNEETPPVPVFHPADRNDRWEHTLLAAYSVALTRHLVAQPFYRYQLTGYTVERRTDQLHSVGCSLAWFFNERVSARIFTSYDLRQSSNPLVADYRKLDAGVGLNLNFRF